MSIRKMSLTLAVQIVLSMGLMQATRADDPTTGSVLQLGKISVASTSDLTTLPSVGPVQIISAAQLQATGLTSVGDILQQLTSMGSGTNAAINSGDGENNLNLRNLGSNRVLVLVNGRRWIQFLQGQVDLNTIPLAIVDHIEILKSGASARYGSGAMAGVVNIVTKRDINGSSASAYLGEYVQGSERDGQTQSYQYTDGHSDQNSDLLFNAAYTKQRPIVGGERDISSVPKYGTGVTRGASVTPQGRFIIVDPNTGQQEDLTVIDGTPGTSPADFRPFDKNSDFFNYAAGNYLLTPSEHSSLLIQGDRDFTDNISLHYTALYNDRRSSQ
ncbi:MAG: TonB-dependent receptor plug domain-containing protein, partial [Gammaproteobacteria bacterium]